jgi:hypothetical protein
VGSVSVIFILERNTPAFDEFPPKITSDRAESKATILMVFPEGLGDAVKILVGLTLVDIVATSTY